MRSASPLGERGSITAKHSVVHLVQHDSEESGGLIVWVWLKLRMDLDDEGASDGGEQTGLRAKSVHAHPNNVHNLRISVSC